jgi:hypothetical protein
MRCAKSFHLILLAIFIWLGSRPATAATLPSPCAESSLSVYLSLEGGCTLTLDRSEFTLKNFEANIATRFLDTRTLTTDDVDVIPTVANHQLSLALRSSMFNISAGERLQLIFQYLIDPPPPILDDLSAELEAQSPVAPGFALVTAEVCASGHFLPTSASVSGTPSSDGTKQCVGDSATYRIFELSHFGDGDPANILFDSVTFPNTSFMDVRTTILLDGGPIGGGGSSQIDGVTYSAGVVTPEPGAGLLVAGGLTAALWFRRRRAAR